jgi:predicted metalloendopeptidase
MKTSNLSLLLIFAIIVQKSNCVAIVENDIDDELINKTRCSTLSCVHSSAILLQKLDLDTQPCEDFYTFACGGYISEQHTPDEKSTVDTLTLMYESLIEYLLRLFEHPSEDTNTKKIHQYAQNFFDSCMDIREKINLIIIN